jgi:hypothetical protein
MMSGFLYGWTLCIMDGDNESNNIFKLQKKVLQIISCIINRTSCRQIFKAYNMLTLPSLYIQEETYFIKKLKILWQKMWTSIIITCEEN